MDHGDLDLDRNHFSVTSLVTAAVKKKLSYLHSRLIYGSYFYSQYILHVANSGVHNTTSSARSAKYINSWFFKYLLDTELLKVIDVSLASAGTHLVLLNLQGFASAILFGAPVFREKATA